MLKSHHKRPVARTEAALIRESGLPEHCPLRDPATMAVFRDAMKAGSDLSLRTRGFLQARTQQDVAAWLGELLVHSRTVFQPWSMEILLLAGALGDVRFSQLQELLGASSRTLSSKLQALTKAGLLDRAVQPGPPLRTQYRLTRSGRAVAAAASPLLAHLHLAALQGGADGR